MKIQNIELSRLLRLGYTISKSNVAVQLYKNFGIDYTFPSIVHAKLTNECNSKCNICDVWRRNEKELPSTLWINALKQLKEINGSYKVDFTGGEVLLKDDVFEIFEFCNQAKIPFTITTNGFLLNSKNIIQLLELQPMNINISLDSLENDIYQKIRGVALLDTVKSNIDDLMIYIQKNSLHTKVFFKTVVNNLNLTELDSIANYAMEKKVAGITFDPIRRRRKVFLEEKIDEFEIMYNIDTGTLQNAKKRLIELKRVNNNIINSENSINQWFVECNTGIKYFCDAPLFRLNITNEGQIKLCDFTESYIGNIVNDDIRLILKSNEIRTEKKKLTNCKKPCVFCIHRNLFDYIRILNSFLRN